MSPQFVDFNADGLIDMLAGTFNGCPSVAYGAKVTDEDGKEKVGFEQPVMIMDAEGERILINQFWNHEAKKWDKTTRSNPESTEEEFPEGHATSAIAFDWNGDGAYDLLLGDYKTGRMYLRMNEGTNKEHKFGAKNIVVNASGVPLVVQGKSMSTMRAVDWNGDGLMDLVVSSMRDGYGGGEGGGVYLYLNKGSKTAPDFDAATTLVPASRFTAKTGPERPDEGLYVDVGDLDGDGKLDLIVGGYSKWVKEVRELNDEQKAELAKAKEEQKIWFEKSSALARKLTAAVKDLEPEEAAKVRAQFAKDNAEERNEINQNLVRLMGVVEEYEPRQPRVSYTWFYRNNTGEKPASDPTASKE